MAQSFAGLALTSRPFGSPSASADLTRAHSLRCSLAPFSLAMLTLLPSCSSTPGLAC